MDYKHSIEHFINQQQQTKQTVYFFKGFPYQFYQQLIQYKNFPRFTDQHLLDVFNPEQSFKFYMLSLLSLDNKVSWGTYEELIALTEVVPNLSQIYQGSIIVVENNLYDQYYECYDEKLIDTINNSNSENQDILYDTFYSDYKVFQSGILIEYILKHRDQELGLQVDEVSFFSNKLHLPHQVEISSSKITYHELNQIIIEILRGTISNKYYSISVTKRNETLINKRLAHINSITQDANVIFTTNTEKIKPEFKEDHLSHFRKYWGADSSYRDALFYENPDFSLDTIKINQGHIISDILLQCDMSRQANDTAHQTSDIIVTAPTGSGKSLFFQIPGIVLHDKYNEVTLVITPLQALMRDQVEKLQQTRGINFATYINSEISYDERKSRIEGIHNGEYSIIYLSPELLLSSSIEDFIGERRIGLFVVDEAHLVTSWGRDFRVDYWFLGEFLNKLRDGQYYSKAEKRKFPVLILTATAIYGGDDDEIGELISSLHLNIDQTEHMYLGYSRKDNIHFKITPHLRKNYDKDPKEDLVIQQINSFILNQEKTIIYCPYTSQVDELYNLYFSKSEANSQLLGRYHGKLSAIEKEETYHKFKSNEITVMLATKAFGMGIDIDDIQNVYHYAPTGTLADYVQEIGRAARQLDEGYAIMDFIVGKDTKYAKTLWGLGGIKQYQIKEIANVLHKMYRKSRKRKLLVSPESFSHIFDTSEVDAKVKSGLMLLINDLQGKHGFKAITIKPRAMYTSQFISIPQSIKEEFLRKYGKYTSIVNQTGKTRVESGYGYRTDVKISLLAEVYEIQLGELWEEQFDHLTFPQFKYQFFKNELFNFEEAVIPKMRLTIDYSSKSYEETKQNFIQLANNIRNTFLAIARNRNLSEFKFNDFYNQFCSKYDEKSKPRQEFVRLLLDVFSFNDGFFNATSQPLWKFVQKRKKADSVEPVYRLVTKKYNYVSQNLNRYIGDLAPNLNDEAYTVFINIPDRGSENKDFKLLCATIMQLFELASFEVQGGKNAQIFVQINDPNKLSQIANSPNYRNGLLQNITKKHDKAIDFMNKFLSEPYSDEERWDIIELFFLGRDEEVLQMLNKELVH